MSSASLVAFLAATSVGLAAGGVAACKSRTFGAARVREDEKAPAPVAPVPVVARWRRGELKDSSLPALLEALKSKTGLALRPEDLSAPQKVEQAHSVYVRYDQTKDGLSIDRASLRVWLSKGSNEILKVETNLFDPKALAGKPSAVSEAAGRTVRKAIEPHLSADGLLGTTSRLGVGPGGLVRRVRVSTKRGHFTFDVSLSGDRILARGFAPLERADADTFSVEAEVYPLYEHPDPAMTWPIIDRKLKPRTKARLSNILSVRQDIDWTVALDALGRAPFDFDKFTLGTPTPEQRSQGVWNDADWYRQFPSFSEQNGKRLPNGVGAVGSVAHLIGRNVGVFFHPKAPLPEGRRRLGGAIWPRYRPTGTAGVLIPDITLLSSPFTSAADLAQRPSVDAKGDPRPDDTAWLAGAGFDEVQVYYSVDRFMESLRSLGFDDPGISTQPFAAILFDPDIEMRNNAYYWLNTINFTTYSKGSLNYARDNTTIWHELGHGIQERLMADWQGDGGGGLSEGMADYLAELVTFAELGRADYPEANLQRIKNRMLFGVTNQVHDEGEAYGGAMLDFTLAAMAKWGHREGLARATDLVLETMRFTRDDPKLSARKWFEEMAEVDGFERKVTGAPSRRPGEMRPLVAAALAGRNSHPTKAPAAFEVALPEAGPVLDTGMGSRAAPLEYTQDGTRKAIAFTVTTRDGEAFKLPGGLVVRIVYPKFNDEPAAIHFEGSEAPFREFPVAINGEPIALEQGFVAKCGKSNLTGGGCRSHVRVELYAAGEPHEKKPLARKRIFVEMK